jgi:hypothetical protein
MTNAEALQVVRQHFESLFPKACASCGREFASLREYILVTKRIGPARSFDADSGDWDTKQPVGSLALANCPCGSTLATGTDGMALPQRLELLSWLKAETQRQGISPSDLLEWLRDEIRTQVLGDGRTS